MNAKLRRDLSILEPRWNKIIESSDVVIIGGGNLFSDVDLNFPLKLEKVLQLASSQGKRIAVLSVGMSDNWSPEAVEMVKNYLSEDASFISCRDGESSALMHEIFEISAPKVLRDPALFLSYLHSDINPKHDKLESRTEYKVIGINIACPSNLSYSGDIEISTANEYHLDYYLRVARIFSARGWGVALFTNGAIEDDNYLDCVKSAMVDSGLGFSLRQNIDSPIDLIETIRSFDLLFSYRMHACIIALSYGIPAISSAWDRKIISLYKELDIDYMLIPSGDMLRDECIESRFMMVLERFESLSLDSYYMDYINSVSEVLS